MKIPAATLGAGMTSSQKSSISSALFLNKKRGPRAKIAEDRVKQ